MASLPAISLFTRRSLASMVEDNKSEVRVEEFRQTTHFHSANGCYGRSPKHGTSVFEQHQRHCHLQPQEISHEVNPEKLEINRLFYHEILGRKTCEQSF